MTEQEWLEGSSPVPMLDSLRAWASERKLRLFSCACCRIWHLLDVGPGREALLVAERYADGISSDRELSVANRRSQRQIENVPYGDAYWTTPGCLVTHESSWEAAECIRHMVSYRRRHEAIQLALCVLIRDIFGNPYRPPMDGSLWRSPQVIGIAQTIYTQHRFEDMPLLADALEEAGCTNQDVLLHCRQPGVHVRGCWVVDLILGKE